MLLPLIAALVLPQDKPTAEGEAIMQRIMAVREVAAEKKASEISQIARSISSKLKGSERVILASLLTGTATEGDIGQDALQTAADTLVAALAKSPEPPEHGQPAYPYVQLAQLERYEHVKVRLAGPELARALKSVDETIAVRSKADFELKDLDGRSWKRSALKGKVVLLNFWATWCPPCRQEMPDLQALNEEFGPQGLVVLAVSDEEPTKVKDFASDAKWTFPVLLDSDKKVGKLYRLESLPKTFVYDREGKLVATGIDMRTRGQFLKMLAMAGLKSSGG